MINRLPLLLLLPCILAVTACSSDNKNSRAPKETYVTVLGDPISVIGDAQTNADFTANDFVDGETLAVSSFNSFEEKMSYQPSDRANIKNKNKTAGREPKQLTGTEAERFLFQIKVISPSQIEFKNAYNPFVLKKVNGKSLVLLKNSAEAELLHISFSSDQNNLSLLIYNSNPASGGRTLETLYFTRSKKSQLKRTTQLFEFFQGTGIKIAWSKKKPVELSLCNASTQLQSKVVATAVKEWKNVLRPALRVSYNGKATRYPPFSDLNFRCIYFVDAYLSDPDPEVFNLGLTVTVANQESSEIADSDVMIFEAEIEKMGPKAYTSIDRILKLVSLHELGHFFGLGHQFNGTQSIMSYDRSETPKIEQHDIEAIQALYE